MVAVDEEVSYGLKKGVYYNSSSSSMSVLCCGSSFRLVVFIKKKSFFGWVGGFVYSFILCAHSLLVFWDVLVFLGKAILNFL